MSLVLSAFTHMWNPIGFPYIHGDEGHYMRRAMHVLEGFGPQEQRNITWSFEQPYDHPYFGQIFLAGVLGIIGYPDILDPKRGDVVSIEMLHMVPRLLMGILAVVDTFLIYKIAERRYGRNVAFVAAALFAVMPMSWLTRRILLDSLSLPFILLSILFAMYTRQPQNNSSSTTITSSFRFLASNKSNNEQNTTVLLLSLISGIFLGLAIFTKIPTITFIPVVAFVIFTNNNKSFKSLGIWFIPVVLLPLLWPAYAISVGEFENWVRGVTWQVAGRTTDSISSAQLWKAVLDVSQIDPVLLVIGFTGLVYAFLKRDYLLLLWIVPFIGFFYFVGYFRYFYWIPVIPIFCIAAALLIVDLPKRIVRTRTKIQRLFQFTVVSAFIIFGLTIMSILLMSNVNANFFAMYAFIVAHLPLHSQKYNVIANGENTIMIGGNWMQTFSWIPKYVFDEDHDFKMFSMKDILDIKDEEKVILIIDNKDLKGFILSKETSKNIKQKELYDRTHLIGKFEPKSVIPANKEYPYPSIHEYPPTRNGIEIRTNY
jgi:hypothetical protein